MGVRVIPAAESSPVADPLETGPPLSSERHDMASTARVMGPACVSARREPFVLPERVLNRRLYFLKWSIFSAWCQDRDLDPVTSDVSVVLSFLKGMLDKQHSSSTIKVYTAAIAAFHVPISSLSVGRASAVITFVQGARIINLHLHLVILQTLLSKATYNWGIHKAINLEESNRQRKCP